jgi:DNA polymerase-3 subunit beta
LKNESSFNVTLPAKTLNDVAKILENEKSVQLYVSDKKVIFQFEKTLVSTRVINGAYPDTSKLIPSTFENKFLTLSQAFISAIDRAALLLTEKESVVKLVVSNEKAEVSSKSQEVGSVVETISTYKYEGSRLEISFTASYVIDAIRAIGTEEIYVLFNGDTKPFILKCKEDPSIVQLVLPVRTY